MPGGSRPSRAIAAPDLQPSVVGRLELGHDVVYAPETNLHALEERVGVLAVSFASVHERAAVRVRSASPDIFDFRLSKS